MKGFYIEITNNLLDPKHRKAMDSSVWLFMWLIDKITSITEEGIGVVLGGKPIKYEEINNDLDIPRRTYVYWIETLRKFGYINTKRTPQGLIFSVNKAKKRFNQRCAKKVTSDVQKSDSRCAKKVTSNKTIQRQDSKTICGKPQSKHKKFINFFYDETKNIRGVKPIITGKDGKNLKRVLDLKILSSDELEQLAVYFLIKFKNFSPSISTFLSAGVLNGLMNRLRNDPEFWKLINNYGYQGIKSENNFVDRLEKLKVEMFSPKKRTQIQEKVSIEERALR